MLTAESKPCTEGQADALTRNEGKIMRLGSRWVQIRLPDSSQPRGRPARAEISPARAAASNVPGSGGESPRPPS